LKEIPKEFELYDMIKTSSAEVIEMLSMEYDVEKHIEKEKDISYYDGLAEGEMSEKISIAKKMLTSSVSIDDISAFTGLTRKEVLKLK
jgi:hypothetical protein